MEHWGPCCLLPCWPIVMHLRYDIIISGMAQERSCPRFYNTHTHICFREENIFYGFLICLSVFFFFFEYSVLYLELNFYFQKLKSKGVSQERRSQPLFSLFIYLFIWGFLFLELDCFLLLPKKKKKMRASNRI